MVDDLIGPTTAIVGIDPRDFFRSYDPSTHRLSFRGESFEIEPLVHAIDALLPIAETESSKPHWEPHPTYHKAPESKSAVQGGH